MDVLFLWYGEGATEAEKSAWEAFSHSDVVKEAMKDASFLEAETREQFEMTHDRLIQEGWALQNIGSGSYTRISSYGKA